MSGLSLQKFMVTELNPDLVSTSFRTQTNWHVITGAPCSGKTTLVKILAHKGFQVVPEMGRLYVEREMAKGKTTDEIIKNSAANQNHIMQMQIEIESGLKVDEVTFLDRGSPDMLTYCRALGLNPNALLAQCFHHQYASVFLLERLPFQSDGTRFEDDAIALLIETWLVRDYTALSYDIVRVPVLPPEERLSFILDRLS